MLRVIRTCRMLCGSAWTPDFKELVRKILVNLHCDKQCHYDKTDTDLRAPDHVSIVFKDIRNSHKQMSLGDSTTQNECNKPIEFMLQINPSWTFGRIAGIVKERLTLHYNAVTESSEEIDVWLIHGGIRLKPETMLASTDIFSGTILYFLEVKSSMHEMVLPYRWKTVLVNCFVQIVNFSIIEFRSKKYLTTMKMRLEQIVIVQNMS